MMEKFKRSDYSEDELNVCKQKAMDLTRDDILRNHRLHKKKDSNTDSDQIITCVINHDPNMVKHLKSFFVQNRVSSNKLWVTTKLSFQR